MRSTAGTLLYVLPALLVAHAIGFWGRGVLDKEAMSFIVNYLADRPLVAAVFDPRVNDWGAYQARELSYLVDLVDARIFAALLDRGVLLFIPVSGVVGLLALAGVYLYGARTVLRLDRITVILLLSLFLSCIVTQASTAYFYRSSKILLSTALMAFLFALTSTLGSEGKADRRSAWRLGGLFVLGVTMSLCDRQGFYLLAVATLVAGLLGLTASARAKSFRTGHVPVVLTCLGALGASALYNHLLAPWVIHRANDYWPSFDYQTLPWADLRVQPLTEQAFAWFRAHVSYLFGNLPFGVVCLLAVVLGLATAWSRRSRPGFSAWSLATGDALMVVLVLALSVIAIMAGMILRHPPVFGSFWYDTLAFETTFLFGTTLGLSASGGLRVRWGRAAIYVLLVLMIAGNVRAYGAQRGIMADSARWFKTQYSRSVTMAREYEAAQRRRSSERRSSWIHLGRDGAIVELPVQDGNPYLEYLDGVQLASAVLKRRPPLGDAGGPYWSALRGFLVGTGSPLSEPEQIGPAIQALRSIGVRRVTLDRSRYTDPDLGRTTAAILTTSAHGTLLWDDGRALTVDLGDIRPQDPVRERLRILDPSSFRAAASHVRERLRLAFDGDPETRWMSGHPQSGDEWFRIDLDQPRDVGRVRMTLLDRSLAEYPRELLIEAGDNAQPQTLYRGSPLPALMRSLLGQPSRPAIDIALPPNRSRTLLLRQVGHTRASSWSIHDLTLWERY
jgi:hypothetical protein